MRRTLRTISVAVVSILWASLSLGQVKTGLYANGAFDNQGFDTVNIGNLNDHFSIPIFAKTGRGGLNFSYRLTYDSSVWTPSSVSGTAAWTPASGWGWSVDTNAITGYLKYYSFQQKCYDTPPGWYWTTTVRNFVYIDAMGGYHYFTGKVSDCSSYGSSSMTVLANDGSGLTLNASTGGSDTITFPNGTTVVPPQNILSGTASITDTNGNKITTSSSGFVDTTGTTVVSISGSGTPALPKVLTYPVPRQSNGSTSATATIYYKAYSVTTAFGCGASGPTEYSATGINLVDHIILADGQTYAFAYNPTTPGATTVDGRIATITLPTGGVITFQYKGANSGIYCSDGSGVELKRSITVPSGASVDYNRTTPTHTIVTDGLSNQSTYDFVSDTNDVSHGPYLVNRKVYQGAASGTPLLFDQTCYNLATPDCTTQSLTLPISAYRITRSLDGTSTMALGGTSNSFGLPTSKWACDFGASSSCTPIYTKNYSYLAYTWGDRLGAVEIIGNSRVSRILYSYDQTSVSTTTGLPQHVSVSGLRGNLTSVNVSWNGTANASSVQRYTYDDAGQIKTSLDAQGNVTNYTYDPGTDTYPTSVQFPTTGSVVHTLPAVWDVASGALTQAKDQSGNPTNYSYDTLNRLSTTSFPNTGSIVLNYNLASGLATVSASILHTSGSTITQTAKLDPYGRLSESETTDAGGDDLIDYTYDANGRTAAMSNPYKAGAGAVFTTYTYDGLGRLYIVTAPDSSKVIYTYLGNSVTLADAASKTRKTVLDGTGRPSAVFEEDGTGSLSIETDYLYDQNAYVSTDSTPSTYQTLVIQKGGSSDSGQWRSRAFTYDLFGRLIQDSTPEAGVTSFSYWNGSAFCAGDVTLPCKRTDANGTITNYSYDALSRLTGKSYGGTTIGTGTAPVNYFYDQGSYNGLSILNGVGQLTGMSDGSGYTAWSFDSMGDITALRKTINGVTKQANYSYNLDSSPNTMQDFGSNLFTYSYDAAGRQTGISDNAGNTYASSATYNAAGQLLSMINQKTSAGGLFARAIQYNNMLQPFTISTTLNGGTIQSLTYAYGAGGTNNGNILSVTNNVDSSRSQTFTYDNMNRLTGGHDNTHWGENYVYDNWGNMYQNNRMSGYSTGGNWQITADVHNHLSNQTYDAAGQVTKDQFANSYAYDAEGRIMTAGGGSYTYDGSGYRVKKASGGTTTLYWPGVAGLQDESDSTGATMARQVYLAGQMIWHESPSGNGEFLFPDHLGSTRVSRDAAGLPKDDIDYLPFGGVAQNYGSSPSDNHYLFTGYESDTSDSSTDYALFRNLSTSMARFNRPDPYHGSYNFTDPQSLNRYSYVSNRPLVSIDPSGLDGYVYSSTGCLLYVHENYVFNADKREWDIQSVDVTVVICPVGGGQAWSFSNTGAVGGPGGNNGHKKSCSTTPGSWLPSGVGVVVGGEATGGFGRAGGTLQGQAGAVGFNGENSELGILPSGSNTGVFASGAATWSFGPWHGGAPDQGSIGNGDATPIAGGGYVGVGGGFIFTNATNIEQLGGPFETVTASGSIGSLSFSWGNGVWAVSITGGPGFGGALTYDRTQTVTSKTVGPC